MEGADQMRLYLPSIVAFAAALGTEIRHAVHPHAERPARPALAGVWVIPED